MSENLQFSARQRELFIKKSTRIAASYVARYPQFNGAIGAALMASERGGI